MYLFTARYQSGIFLGLSKICLYLVYRVNSISNSIIAVFRVNEISFSICHKSLSEVLTISTYELNVTFSVSNKLHLISMPDVVHHYSKTKTLLAVSVCRRVLFFLHFLSEKDAVHSTGPLFVLNLFFIIRACLFLLNLVYKYSEKYASEI